ncbi:type II toxin-antitoxin system VapC family toxin [Nitrospira sp. Nam74]
MNYLLDTHVYLWYVADSPKLSKQIRHRIQKAPVVFVSAASIWEAVLKIHLKKLTANPHELVEGIAASGFNELPVTALHTLGLQHMPWHHRDPFDRLLMAQAQSDHLHFLTADTQLHHYGDFIEVI